MRLALLTIPLLALTACQEGGAPDLGGPDECGASGWQYLVGEHRDVLADLALPDRTRVIGPNDAVTLDLSLERLNILYDEDGVITQANCG